MDANNQQQNQTQNAQTQQPQAAGAQNADTIDQKEVMEAIQTIKSKYPEQAKIFDEAPEGARHRIGLNFWVTVCKDKPTFNRRVYLTLRTNLEKNLSPDDLEYLILTADKDSLKNHYRQLLLEKTGGGADGQPQQQGQVQQPNNASNGGQNNA